MTIPYDEALRERIRDHLAGHDRRVVADPTKRHAAVAVCSSSRRSGRTGSTRRRSTIGERERLMPEAGLDGRMVDGSGGAGFLLCRRTSCLNSDPAQWALPGGRTGTRGGCG